MKTYQVKKYFEWGGLKLEPLQYLNVDEGSVGDTLTIFIEKTQESIIVSKKAFENQLKLGTIMQK